MLLQDNLLHKSDLRLFSERMGVEGNSFVVQHKLRKVQITTRALELPMKSCKNGLAMVRIQGEVRCTTLQVFSSTSKFSIEPPVCVID